MDSIWIRNPAIGISVSTLRRWVKAGILLSCKKKGLRGKKRLHVDLHRVDELKAMSPAERLLLLKPRKKTRRYVRDKFTLEQIKGFYEAYCKYKTLRILAKEAGVCTATMRIMIKEYEKENVQ